MIFIVCNCTFYHICRVYLTCLFVYLIRIIIYSIIFPFLGSLYLEWLPYFRYYKTPWNRRRSWIEDAPKGLLKKEYKTLLIIRPNSATVWDRDMYNTVLEFSEHFDMESGRYNSFWESFITWLFWKEVPNC